MEQMLLAVVEVGFQNRAAQHPEALAAQES
jgi:hypothetical protein